MTTSHLTNPAKDAGQVIGYSHSTRPPAEELLAGHPKDGSQVAGYKLANYANQVIG
jgi:anthranilate phosphoribosyltransferase